MSPAILGPSAITATTRSRNTSISPAVLPGPGHHPGGQLHGLVEAELFEVSDQPAADRRVADAEAVSYGGDAAPAR